MNTSSIQDKHAIKNTERWKKYQNWCLFLSTNSNAFNHVYDTFDIVNFHALCFGYRKDLLCQEGIMLLWHGQIPFCCSLMFKKRLSLSNHSIGVCVKSKRINRGVGYGLEIPVEYIFYGNEKAIQRAKRTLDCVDGNVKKRNKIFKTRSFWKKSYLIPICVLFFLACPLLEGSLHKDNPNRASTFRPLMSDVCYFCSLFRVFFMRDWY